MFKQAAIFGLLILGGLTLTGCYNKSAERPSSDLITKPTTDFTVFKSKF